MNPASDTVQAAFRRKSVFSIVARMCSLFVSAVRRFSISSVVVAYFAVLPLIHAGAQHHKLSPAEEQRYWREMHQREAAKAQNEEQHQAELSAAAAAAIPTLVQEGSAGQADFIRAEDGEEPPEPPSIFREHADYFIYGGVCVLLAAVTWITLVRHKREAEIRALSGKYLSDGTEMAWLEMPSLFEPAPAAGSTRTKEDDFADNTPKRDPMAEKVAEFFTGVREHLANLRSGLQELGGATEEPERKTILSGLHKSILAIKESAAPWELRPVWQMTSGLDLLVGRLAEKPRDATPSVIRTTAAAVDLLHDLCVPGIRPNLIIDPPIKILAVDDEALCRRALVFALQKANLETDLAEDGVLAVAAASRQAYDVVFMDINMPEMDGLTACKRIHETEKNRYTPVVFVTVQSDFQTRAQSTVFGGSDLMAKPFLVFEMTVKALTLIMRKRLQIQQSAGQPTPLVTAPAGQAADAIPAAA